jgi:putative oxidoreductase
MCIGSYALILFTVAATIMFHNPMNDPKQMTAMLKNIAIVGGLLLLSISKPKRFVLCK